MNLISKQYDKTEVQITSFETKKGITEYHLLFQQTDCLEDYPTQLQNLLQAYTQGTPPSRIPPLLPERCHQPDSIADGTGPQ